MVDPIASRILVFRTLFAAVVVFVTFARLLPVSAVSTGALPGPDILIALTCAWVLRRPAYVPAAFLVALFIFVDLMSQMPPGLGALSILAGSEFLRARFNLLRELPFPAEWAVVTATIVAMAALSHIVMAFLIADRAPLGLQLVQALFTAAIYPLAALVTAYVFGIRKPSPGELEALGGRL